MKLFKTSVGLPNSCAKCGDPVSGEWFVESDDAARSGQGVCKKHVDDEGNLIEGKVKAIQPEPEPKPETERKQAQLASAIKAAKVPTKRAHKP